MNLESQPIKSNPTTCLSETYVDTNILPDDSNLEIPGYNLVHSDHLSNKKCEGICVHSDFLLLLEYNSPAKVLA